MGRRSEGVLHSISLRKPLHRGDSPQKTQKGQNAGEADESDHRGRIPKEIYASIRIIRLICVLLTRQPKSDNMALLMDGTHDQPAEILLVSG
jgi:hypothetical protein